MGKGTIYRISSIGLICAVGSMACGVALAKTTTIRWSASISNPERMKMCKELVETFEKSNPSIKVKFEPTGDLMSTLLVSAAAGTAPDVVWGWGAQYWPLVERNMLVDLTPNFTKDLGTKDFIPETLDAAKYKGKIYSVDGRATAMFLYYNQTLFSQAGVGNPNQLDASGGWTRDAFTEAAKKMTKDTNGDGKIDIYGHSIRTGDEYMAGWIYSDGGKLLNADKTSYQINDNNTVKTFKYFYDMIYKYKITAAPGKTQDWPGFQKAKVATIEAGAWDFGIYRAAKVPWDIVPIPRGSAGRVNSFLSGGAYWIMRGTKHLPESWKFVKWLYGREAQRINIKYGEVPMTISTLTSDEFIHHKSGQPAHARVAYDIMKGAKPFIYPPSSQRWYEILNPILDRIWSDRISVEDGLNSAAKELNKLLASKKK